MTMRRFPEPDITLDVDLRNPGQFFACCGTLELASRFWTASEANGWREPEGWFDGDQFHIATYAQTNQLPLTEIIRCLTEAEPLVARDDDADAFADEKVAPLRFLPANLRLDWWLKRSDSLEAGIFKLWSGQQRPEMIFADLHGEFQKMRHESGHDLLRARRPMTGRFGFDPGPAWDALDVGFSPNEQGVAVLTAPATEILAAVGLQGFRPHQEGRRGFAYAAWDNALPIELARAATAGTFGGRRFRFNVNNRGKYKAFGFAEEIEERGL